MASARGVGERGRARDEYDAISRALPLLDAAGSPGTTLRVSAYISWTGTSCYAAMLQRAGVLTAAAEGAAWSYDGDHTISVAVVAVVDRVA